MHKILTAAALGAAFFMAGCQGVPNDARLASACRAYAATLSTVADLKSEMTAPQTRTVDRVVAVVGPVCREGAEIDGYASAVAKVSDGLRDLATLEATLKGERT